MGPELDQVEGRLDRGITSRHHPFVPSSCLFVRKQFRLAGGDITHHSHSIGMIGDDQPVQRT